MMINLRSRLANKVYLPVASGDVLEYEDLFQLAQSVDRSDYVPVNHGITIKPHTKSSLLHAPRTIQSITHKSVITQLTGSPDQPRQTAPDLAPIEIFVPIIQNTATLYVNTSGKSLHQRGRKRLAGEASLKENLAAVLVPLNRWTYSTPLIDPMCGTGTILIEAATIARNIAPGLSRSFTFESFPSRNDLMPKREDTKTTAKSKQYDSTYQIRGYDIDPDALSIAKRNASIAGVGDTIQRHQQDFSEHPLSHYSLADEWSLITNPPYGKRLAAEGNIAPLYQSLILQTVATPACKTTIITGRDDANLHFRSTDRSAKQTKNGPDTVVIYTKKR